MFYVSELFVTDKKCISFSIYRIFKIFLQKNVESEFQNGNFGNRPKRSSPEKVAMSKIPKFSKKISRTGGKLDKK